MRYRWLVRIGGWRSLLRIASRGLRGARLLLLAPGMCIAMLAHADDLDQRIEEARQRLDAAAHEFAELHRERAQSFMNHPADKPMLGVLIGGRGERGGIVIAGVTPGGGAAAVGLAAGDELLAVQGKSLVDGGAAAIGHAMEGLTAGDTVRVEYARGDTTENVDLVTTGLSAHQVGFVSEGGDFDFDMDFAALESAVEGAATAAAEAGAALHEIEIEGGPHHAIRILGKQGVHVVEMDPDLAGYFGGTEGLLVTRAPEAGELKGGDVVTAVNGKPVTGMADLIAVVRTGNDSPASLSVMRQGAQISVSVDPAMLLPGLAGRLGSAWSSQPGEDVEVMVIEGG